MFPVPLNSSKITSSMREPVSTSAVAMIVSEPPSSMFRADQLEHVYTLRRGLQQMPSSSAMEWLIKRIAATANNDALLEGL